MDVKKAPVAKETVDGKAQKAAQPADRAERIGSRPQVRDFAQILEAVPLFLQRVFGRGEIVNADERRPDLVPLAFSRRIDDRPLNGNAAAGGKPQNIGPIVREFRHGHDLDVRKT